MGEYYGNNDWRDYQTLKHYGVKGMKWGKRKKRDLNIRFDKSGENPYGWSHKGVYLQDKNGTIVSLTSSRHKTKGRNIEITTRRRKSGDTYDRSTKHISNYSDDPDYRTVGIKTGPKKRSINRAKSKLTSFFKKKRSIKIESDPFKKSNVSGTSSSKKKRKLKIENKFTWLGN